MLNLRESEFSVIKGTSDKKFDFGHYWEVKAFFSISTISSSFVPIGIHVEEVRTFYSLL